MDPCVANGAPRGEAKARLSAIVFSRAARSAINMAGRRLMALTAILLRLVAPTPGARPAATIATLLIFALGAGGALVWTLSALGPVLFVLVVALVTALAAGWMLPRRRSSLWVAAGVVLVLLHLFWLALAAALMTVLAWSVPIWMWVADAVVAAVAVGGAIRPRAFLRIPVALPVGATIAMLLGGWMREDGVVRCDDYERVRAASISVVVPSTPELARCAAGESLLIQRYPRQLWEAPGGDRFVFTTQRGDHDLSIGAGRHRPLPNWIDGAICEADAGSTRAPRCLAKGKAHGIAESRLRDRLYVVSHGSEDGRVYALPRNGPFRPLEEVTLSAKAGLLYLDDERDILAVYEDMGRSVYLLRADDLSLIETVPTAFLPDAAHYDQARHEGIACAAIGPLLRIDGDAYTAVAFDGDPFTVRPLAPSSRYPSSWLAATWGCDWVPATRRAYVAVASLGVLEEIDYDSGDIVRWSFIWPGARSVVVDPERRRIYVGFFLSGDVIAIDMDSRAVVARWPAGRFVRQMVLARNKGSLLVASNLGIVRIPLGPAVSPSVGAG